MQIKQEKRLKPKLHDKLKLIDKRKLRLIEIELEEDFLDTEDNYLILLRILLLLHFRLHFPLLNLLYLESYDMVNQI